MGLEVDRIVSTSRKRVFQGLKLILATITGSLIGGVVTYFLLGEPALRYSLAISAGMGWYSFTGTYLAGIDPATKNRVRVEAPNFSIMMANPSTPGTRSLN